MLFLPLYSSLSLLPLERASPRKSGKEVLEGKILKFPIHHIAPTTRSVIRNRRRSKRNSIFEQRNPVASKLHEETHTHMAGLRALYHRIPPETGNCTEERVSGIRLPEIPGRSWWTYRNPVSDGKRME
uniref:Putative secreted protein n=1 Tax=Anopheles darlingi TaxID=43151 RepID=A0A2M4D8R1_ANODA